MTNNKEYIYLNEEANAAGRVAEAQNVTVKATGCGLDPHFF